jgi:hypothetical protein
MTDSFDVKITVTLSVSADKKTFCEKSMQENVQLAATLTWLWFLILSKRL